MVILNINHFFATPSSVLLYRLLLLLLLHSINVTHTKQWKEFGRGKSISQSHILLLSNKLFQFFYWPSFRPFFWTPLLSRVSSPVELSLRYLYSIQCQVEPIKACWGNERQQKIDLFLYYTSSSCNRPVSQWWRCGDETETIDCEPTRSSSAPPAYGAETKRNWSELDWTGDGQAGKRLDETGIETTGYSFHLSVPWPCPGRENKYFTLCKASVKLWNCRSGVWTEGGGGDCGMPRWLTGE